MPELPEVQTVVDNIRSKLINKKISACRIYKSYSRILCGNSIRTLNKQVKKQQINNVRRRAKYIVLDLDRGCLAFHLRMTGQIQFATKTPKYSTFSMELSRGQMHLVDVRKFGTVEYYEEFDQLDHKLGLEPLSRNFTWQALKDLLSKSSAQLKPYLLNQKHIAGLGNIYVDEALWLAKLHPQTICNSISSNKIKALNAAIKQVLRKSIKYQGTTFINFAFDNARTGNFQKQLKVFNKTGQTCKNRGCNAKIVKIKVAQRGTHFCPRCQKI